VKQKCVYFVSYQYLRETGAWGVAMSGIVWERPLTRFSDLQEVRDRIAEVEGVDNVVITNFQLLDIEVEDEDEAGA